MLPRRTLPAQRPRRPLRTTSESERIEKWRPGYCPASMATMPGTLMRDGTAAAPGDAATGESGSAATSPAMGLERWPELEVDLRACRVLRWRASESCRPTTSLTNTAVGRGKSRVRSLQSRL